MNEVYTDLEELAKKFEATDKLVLIQTIGELEKQIKELKEYAHHHQSCDSVGVYGKLDIECNCGLKQALK
jgi:hypothetical protein